MSDAAPQFEEIKIPLPDRLHDLDAVTGLLGIPEWWPTGSRVALVVARASGEPDPLIPLYIVEAALAQARITFQNAKSVLDLTSGGSDSQSLRDETQIIFDDAKIALEDAQKDYDDELTTEDTTDILEARAKVVVAQEI